MEFWLFTISRLAMGGAFVWFGLNGFFHWRPLPPMNPDMTAFNENMQKTKILMPVVKIFEIVFGLALVLNQWTLLATVALAPVVFFIALAHFSFNREKGLPLSLSFVIAEGILVIHHWSSLRPLFERGSF